MTGCGHLTNELLLLLYTSYLPAMVRPALVVGDPKLVERLTEGVTSVHPTASTRS